MSADLLKIGADMERSSEQPPSEKKSDCQGSQRRGAVYERKQRAAAGEQDGGCLPSRTETRLHVQINRRKVHTCRKSVSNML